MKAGYVYIMSNKNHRVLYTGVTSNLKKRIHEHKTGTGSQFTKKYNVKKLLWFDQYPRMMDAIHREKQIKRYKREWKFNLIKELNPGFRDLYDVI